MHLPSLRLVAQVNHNLHPNERRGDIVMPRVVMAVRTGFVFMGQLHYAEQSFDMADLKAKGIIDDNDIEALLMGKTVPKSIPVTFAQDHAG